MKTIAQKLVVLAAFGASYWGAGVQDAQALQLGHSMGLRHAITRVQGAAPALAPMAHLIFCNQYRDQCVTSPQKLLDADDGTMRMLTQVNEAVNEAIVPTPRNDGHVGSWQISPRGGDCNDYAVTKRQQLLAIGFPASALLLAHVVTTWGEHHLVLVVRTVEADYVLDNLRTSIKKAEKTGYRWVKIQSETSPTMWNEANIRRQSEPAAEAPIFHLASLHEIEGENQAGNAIWKDDCFDP